MINLVDVLSLTVELVFAASLLGFIILTVMIPSKKAIDEGRGGNKIGSALVPILMVFGSLTAVSTIPLSLLTSDTWLRIAGMVTGPPLVLAYLLIFVEYRRRKSQLSSMAPPLEVEVVPSARATVPAPPGPGMTVECPRCRGRLIIQAGSSSIICPHCGLSGSL